MSIRIEVNGVVLWLGIGLCVVSFEAAAVTAEQHPTSVQGAVVASCNVSPLAPTPESVEPFEKSPSTPPESALRDISERLQVLVGQLTRDMAARGIKVRQTSGYRPKEYQQHFYDISRKWRALQHAYAENAQQRLACTDIQAHVDSEVRKHGLKTAPAERRTEKGVVSVLKGQPMVNPPGQSNHEVRPAALAVDLVATPPSPVFLQQARELGLTQPCPKDTVHFSTGHVKCVWTAEITGHSPIRLWLIDPMGRRLGFDPVSGQHFNEIGDGAQYSRTDDLETLVVAAMPGNYRIGGLGTAAGPYRISLVAFNEAGQIRAATAWTGTTAEGRPLPQRRIDLFRSPAPQPAAAPAGPAPNGGGATGPVGQPALPQPPSPTTPDQPADSDGDSDDPDGWVVEMVAGVMLAAGALAGFLQLRRRRSAERP